MNRTQHNSVLGRVLAALLLCLMLLLLMCAQAAALEKKTKGGQKTRDPQLTLIVSKTSIATGDTVSLEIMAPESYGWHNKGYAWPMDENGYVMLERYPERMRIYANDTCIAERSLDWTSGWEEPTDMWRCAVTLTEPANLVAAISYNGSDWLYTDNDVFVNTQLGVRAAPVQYLADGLSIRWDAVADSDAYELRIVTDDDSFTMSKVVPADGREEYALTINQSELAGYGEYMICITASNQGKVIKQSRDLFVTMQVCRDLDDAFRKASTELENPYLQLSSAFMMTAAYDQAEVQAYLNNLGFQGIESYNYLDVIRTEKDHLVAYTFAYKDMLDQDQKIRIYAVIVRGTTGMNEWISNFTIGSGPHVYGFTMAAQECMERFWKYYAIYPPDRYSPSKVWITGHSRGAAVGNIMAAQFLRDDAFQEKDIYAHLFACPRVTLEAYALPTMAIRSYNCSEDMVTRVPPIEWGYANHGTNFVYQTSSHDDGLLKLNILLQTTFQLIPTREFYNELFDTIMNTESASYLKKVICGTFSIESIDWLAFCEDLLDVIRNRIDESDNIDVKDAVRTALKAGDATVLVKVFGDYFPYFSSHSKTNYCSIAWEKTLEKMGDEFCNGVYNAIHGLQ